MVCDRLTTRNAHGVEQNGTARDFEASVADGWYTLVAEEPPKPAVGQVWRPKPGHGWTTLSEFTLAKQWLENTDTWNVRWSDDGSGGNVSAACLSKCEFVSHGTAPSPHVPKGAGNYSIAMPAESPKPTVQPRCGQRWRLTEDWNNRDHLGGHKRKGQTIELVDEISRHTISDGQVLAVFVARFDDGSKVDRVRFSLPMTESSVEYVSGPTAPETPREAFERVVRLEGASPPDGLSESDWLARLVNVCDDETICANWRLDTDEVRRIAASLRVEHAARWQAWQGDASKGVR